MLAEKASSPCAPETQQKHMRQLPIRPVPTFQSVLLSEHSSSRDRRVFPIHDSSQEGAKKAEPEFEGSVRFRRGSSPCGFGRGMSKSIYHDRIETGQQCIEKMHHVLPTQQQFKNGSSSGHLVHQVVTSPALRSNHRSQSFDTSRGNRSLKDNSLKDKNKTKLYQSNELKQDNANRHEVKKKKEIENGMRTRLTESSSTKKTTESLLGYEM